MHQQTTTTVTMTTTEQPSMRFDPSYIRTIPGILKIAQMILDIVGIICISVSKYNIHSRAGWFNTVAMAGFWITALLLVFYLFHVIERFSNIPWLKIEFIAYSVITVCYLLAASFAADYGRLDEAFAAAAVFGFCAMALYGYDAWLKFKMIRSG